MYGSLRSSVDGLPDLQLLAGPHATCHWMSPKLLAGSYPGDRSEPNHSTKVRCLLDQGVDTFICLQERAELKRFTPYIQTAQHVSRCEPEFLHCPIPDLDVTSDDQLLIALRTLVTKLLQGHVVYVHCWGGHGRTGTLICALLVTCYGLSPAEAEVVYNRGEQLRGARVGVWPHAAAQSLDMRSVCLWVKFVGLKCKKTRDLAYRHAILRGYELPSYVNCVS